MIHWNAITFQAYLHLLTHAVSPQEEFLELQRALKFPKQMLDERCIDYFILVKSVLVEEQKINHSTDLSNISRKCFSVLLTPHTSETPLVYDRPGLGVSGETAERLLRHEWGLECSDESADRSACPFDLGRAPCSWDKRERTVRYTLEQHKMLPPSKRNFLSHRMLFYDW